MSRKSYTERPWRPLAQPKPKTVTAPLVHTITPPIVSEVPFGVDAAPKKAVRSDLELYEMFGHLPWEERQQAIKTQLWRDSLSFETVISPRNVIYPKEIAVANDPELVISLTNALDAVEVSEGVSIFEYCGITDSEEFARTMQEIEEDSDSSDSDDDYEYEPYASENHVAQTKGGEVLVGGMPQRKGGRKKGRQRVGPRRPVTVPRGPVLHNTFSRSMQVPFVFDYNFELTGTSVVEFNVRVNDLYNILGAGTPTEFFPGRTPYSLIYTFGRLVRFSATYTIVNESADNSYELCAGPTNTALGSPTQTTFKTLKSQRGARRATVSVRGGMDRAKIKIKSTALALAGDPAAATDDSYLSGWSTSPDNLLFGSIMARSYNGANVTELYCTLTLTSVFELSHLAVTAGAPSPVPWPVVGMNPINHQYRPQEVPLTLEQMIAKTRDAYMAALAAAETRRCTTTAT